MNSSSNISPGCVGGRLRGGRPPGEFRVGLDFPRLVVICDFDFVGMSTLPSETDPVLGVDTYAILTVSLTTEAFKRIPRWNG